MLKEHLKIAMQILNCLAHRRYFSRGWGEGGMGLKIKKNRRYRSQIFSSFDILRNPATFENISHFANSISLCQSLFNKV